MTLGNEVAVFVNIGLAVVVTLLALLRGGTG
jgi:hypothetical protein